MEVMGLWMPIYCPLFPFFPPPFLFTLDADSFSKIIVHAEPIGLFKGFQVEDDKVNVSHLQFADDKLLLMDGEQSNMSILKSLIHCFELVFG